MPDGLPQQNRLKPLRRLHMEPLQQTDAWKNYNKGDQELYWFRLVEVKMGLKVDFKSSIHEVGEEKKNRFYALNIEAL